MATTAPMTAAEFGQRVRQLLLRATKAVPDAVPNDVFDPVAADMMAALEELDELLYGLGYEGRRREDQERERVAKIQARQRDRTLEDRVMLLDQRVQRTIEALGGDPTLQSVSTPMHADMLADSLLQLLDAFPACAFAHNRIIPPGFASDRDPDVAAVIRIMRDRKVRRGTP